MSRLLVDAGAIRALADILNETGLTEIEIAEKDSRIRVVRAPAVVQAVAPMVSAGIAQAPAVVAAVTEASIAADHAKHPGAVKSPMVGVAYLSPEPGSPPYVTVGQSIDAGQTLLLIEAMKTFNQIKAAKAGTVKQILVQPGAPVEYDEPLLIIE